MKTFGEMVRLMEAFNNKLAGQLTPTLNRLHITHDQIAVADDDTLVKSGIKPRNEQHRSFPFVIEFQDGSTATWIGGGWVSNP